MYSIHQITETDSWFLDLKKKDPITGRTFCAGDRIVICAICKNVYLVDTWENLNQRRCTSIYCCNSDQNLGTTLGKFTKEAFFNTKESAPITFVIRSKSTSQEISLDKQPLHKRIKRFLKNIFGGK